MVLNGTVSLKDYQKLKKSIELFKLNTLAPSNLGSLQNLWIHGDPGVGKSSGVRDIFPNYFDKPVNKWWDGYKCQPTVILDDFETTHDGLSHHLKRWADHYPFIAETKGGTCLLRPERIVVTSNHHPGNIWYEKPSTLAAIERRFKILNLKEGESLKEKLN